MDILHKLAEATARLLGRQKLVVQEADVRIEGHDRVFPTYIISGDGWRFGVLAEDMDGNVRTADDMIEEMEARSKMGRLRPMVN